MQYKTGTVSVTNGSAVVTGAGTSWLSEVEVGDGFIIRGIAATYDIASVDSNTQLTLSVGYAGSTASGVSYTIQRDFTSENSIPEMSDGDIETATIFTRSMRTIQDVLSTKAVGSDLDQVDNTSDQDKPVSTAQQTALNAKVNNSAIGTVASKDLATSNQALAGTADVIPDAEKTLSVVQTAARDTLRESVEAASGGRMSVFYTTKGQPSYFVRQPAFNCEDVAPGGELGTGVHEAFIFDGVQDAEIWIGAFAATVIDGEAVCQPGVAPGVSINYDQARQACQAAGAGFDLMTVWDWAAVMHWCMARGFEPRGNTDYGRHHDNRWEIGARQDAGAPGSSSGIGNILAGSGPVEWRHDGTTAGISDLVGNVWEWLLGMTMIDGRINLSPDNAIPLEGAYSDTGFDMPSSRTWATMDTTGAGDLLKRAGIAPKGSGDPVGYLYTNLEGERLPVRGGARNYGGNAGLGALLLYNSRAYAGNIIGFRPRFRNPKP